MPGLFGIVHSADALHPLRPAFDRVFAPTQRTFTSEQLVDEPRWALGRTHLGVLQPDAQLDPQQPVQVLFHGDLYNAPALAASCGLPSTVPARIIAALYRREGTAFATRLEGAFCLAIVDPAADRVVLVADELGSYPLYWTKSRSAFVFGSELSAVLRHPDAPRALDGAAAADYLTFGFPLGDKTLARGVHLLSAGSVLVHDGRTNTVTTTQYRNVVDYFVPWDGTRDQYTAALCEAFTNAVRRSASGPHALGLSLSGGLDSRAILSALNGQAASTASYTLGVRGCADEVIAAQLAKRAGTQHTFFELDARYLKEFLPNLARMVSLTDGMYLSHGLTEMLALNFLTSASFSVLVRGHGGELAKTNLAWPLHTDERVSAFTAAGELIPYLLRRANYISPGVDTQQLFTDDWAPHVAGTAQRSLEQSLSGVDLHPSDLCSYIYLMEHHRRFTTASIELFRQAVEVRLPFVDREFLTVLFRGRPEWRADTSIHRALTASGDRALLRVRNSNTGAPADASAVAEFALDKLNTLFKRLNVPGYRHYHNFQAWMSEQLLNSVEDVLLGPTSLQRGVLREGTLRTLVDETRQNRADHSYLLQVLLILELWQQENL